MKSVFESMGGTYTQSGDYFIPDIALPKTGNRKIGRYGRMRHRYLKEHRPVIYNVMLLSGDLFSHLAEVCRVLRMGPYLQPTPVARWGPLTHVFHR